MNMFKNATIGVFLGIGGPAWAIDTPIFYFFGDSALEQGNYQILSQRTCADFPNYYCGSDGLHRDSNGPVLVEFLGLDVKTVSSEPESYGALNFAIGGAHMGNRGEDIFEFPTGVTKQIEDWRGGVVSGAYSIGPQDIFVIQAGGNDFLIRFQVGDSFEAIEQGIVDAAVTNVMALVDGGAKNIVMWEVETVDYIGYLLGDENDDLRAVVRDAVDRTNVAMGEALIELRASLPSDVTVSTIPHRPMIEYLEQNALELGLTNGINYCLDLEESILCSAEMATQNTYMLFDQVPLTTAAQKVEAAWFEAYIQKDFGITLTESWSDYNFNFAPPTSP